MVQFTNICADGDFIYADIEDMDNKRKFKVRVCKKDDSFETQPNDFTYNVGMAIWGMVDKYEKSERTISHCSIVWG